MKWVRIHLEVIDEMGKNTPRVIEKKNTFHEHSPNTYTVGTYSPGKLSVVYDINIHVFPTVPSPTTTHLIGLPWAMLFSMP